MHLGRRLFHLSQQADWRLTSEETWARSGGGIGILLVVEQPRQTGGVAAANLLCIVAARFSPEPAKAARRNSRRGPRRHREFRLRDSRLQTRRTTTRMVCRLEATHQPLPDERGDQTRPCGRTQGIQDLEGNDSISTCQAATIGFCEATRESTYRRVTIKSQSVTKSTEATGTDPISQTPNAEEVS